MMEAVIISEMEKLGSLLVEKRNLDPYIKRDAEQFICDLKVFLSLVREKKLEEGSSLNYLRSDVVEMVRNLLIEIDDDHITSANVQHIWSELKETNEQLRELSQNEGIGEGDGDHVVELKEDVELLLHKMNVGSFRGPCVACIKGIGGSGKTTLAGQLYSHADVVQTFERRAWINCKKILSPKELLISLIRQLADNDPDSAEEMELAGRRSLQNMLAEQLRGKRYFIVLDDIRRFTYLSLVIQSFHDEDKKSRVLVTAPTGVIVRRHYPLVNYFHDMKPLDLDKSWELLVKTTFSSNNSSCAYNFPKKLERKGKEMLMKHSGGVPLAIKEVGMEWVEKRRLGSEWQQVVESRDLKLKASLAALESSSYKYLDREVKSCFLHLGFFKEGTTIRAEKLVQIWIAGLVVSQEEEKNQTCLRSLIRQNIIEVKDKAKDKRIKNCRAGAIFHKLSIMKRKEENARASRVPRHRIIYCSRERFNNYSMNQDKQLLSLFHHGGGFFDASTSYWKCFEQLRVLDFEGFGVKFLPETIGELIELRYMGLRNNYIQELPPSLVSLKNLEVLDIAHNFMVEMPDIVLEMKALRHLYMSDISCRKLWRMKALNLETLTYISVDNWAYEVSNFQMMHSLRKLGIEELDENSDVSKLFASLAKLFLECLVLRGFRFRSMPLLDKLGVLCYLLELKLDGLITRLPSAENFPPRLSYLSLINSRLDEDPMPLLEKIFKLQYLKLQNAYTGRQMVISKGGFPRLNHLCIGELWHLRNIQVGYRAFWQLGKVEINSCPYLETLPQDMMIHNLL